MQNPGHFSGNDFTMFSVDAQKLHDEIRSRMAFINLNEVSCFASVVVRILAEQQLEMNKMRDRIRELESATMSHGR